MWQVTGCSYWAFTRKLRHLAEAKNRQSSGELSRLRALKSHVHQAPDCWQLYLHPILAGWHLSSPSAAGAALCWSRRQEYRVAGLTSRSDTSRAILLQIIFLPLTPTSALVVFPFILAAPHPSVCLLVCLSQWSQLTASVGAAWTAQQQLSLSSALWCYRSRALISGYNWTCQNMSAK